MDSPSEAADEEPAAAPSQQIQHCEEKTPD